MFHTVNMRIGPEIISFLENECTFPCSTVRFRGATSTSNWIPKATSLKMSCSNAILSEFIIYTRNVAVFCVSVLPSVLCMWDDELRA